MNQTAKCKFQIFIGDDKEFWWRFGIVGAGGEIVEIIAVSGEGHRLVKDCHRDIAVIKHFAPNAPIDEPSSMAQALIMRQRGT